MRNLLPHGIAAAAALASSAPAVAAVTIADINFTATTGGPITDHSGSFTVSFDDQSGELNLLAVDFSIGDHVFSLADTSILRRFGGYFIYSNIEESVLLYTSDFWLYANPQFGEGFAYATPSTQAYTVYTGPNLSINIVQEVNGAVPEPAIWAMMLLGFFGVGAMARWKKTVESPQVSYDF